MYSYTLLLLAAIQAVVSSTSISYTALRGNQESKKDRRRLLEQVTCYLYIRDIEYFPTPQNPKGYSEREWDCQFTPEDSDILGITFAKIEQQDFINIDSEAVEHNIHDHHFDNAVSGVSTMIVNRAIIDTESFKMFLPSNAIVQVRTERDRERRLSSKTMGNLKTIMVRIIDNQNRQPTKSISDLRNDVFLDSSCLKSQMEGCSHGKVTIAPHGGTGVFDLHVDHDLAESNNGDVLHNKAFLAFQAQFGDPFDTSKFDLVMFCNPPQYTQIAGAWGQVNGPISNYADDWCSSVAGQMHEVGHNLGLEHSGEGGDQYGDTSGYMGSTSQNDDHSMCFNAAKSFQLGWYNDKSLSFNPLNQNNPVRRVTLNGVVDYGKNPNALITVRLEETNKASDYYIGYNRKAGLNSQTSENADMVTISRKDGAPDHASFSWKVASLIPGNSFIIDNFNGQRKVEIIFVGKSNDLRDAVVDIIDHQYKPAPPQENCEKHTIEIKTDGYPGDTSWELRETTGIGRGFGSPPDYTNSNTVYKTEVCLPYSNNYKFTIFDGFADGICCGQGQGYYKIYKNSNNQIKAQGGEFKEFDVRTFSTGSDPNPPTPTRAPTPFPTNAPTPFPTNAPTKAPTEPTGDNSGCDNYTVEIHTDNFPEDTSWEILNIHGNKKGGRDTFPDKMTVVTDTICLNKGNTFKFVMKDSHGDGVCCSQGNGYYKLKDASGNVIVDGETGGFTSRDYDFVVPNGDSPPPPPSGGCENFTVEIKTDNFAEDSSWKILDASGNEKFSRDSFSGANTVFEDTVCLDSGNDYKFQMFDSFNDGICCSHGNGYFKVKDSSGNVVVDTTDGSFGLKEHTISVGGGTSSVICEDRQGRFKWKPSSASRACSFWSKRKCNTINQFTNLPIWHDCPVSCNRCDDL